LEDAPIASRGQDGGVHPRFGGVPSHPRARRGTVAARRTAVELRVPCPPRGKEPLVLGGKEPRHRGGRHSQDGIRGCPRRTTLGAPACPFSAGPFRASTCRPRPCGLAALRPRGLADSRTRGLADSRTRGLGLPFQGLGRPLRLPSNTPIRPQTSTGATPSPFKHSDSLKTLRLGHRLLRAPLRLPSTTPTRRPSAPLLFLGHTRHPFDLVPRVPPPSPPSRS